MPVEARDALRHGLEPYRLAHPAARWLAPETWHVTLLFLAAVPVGRVPDLVGLVDQVAVRHERFACSIARGGGRLRGAEGIAWLKVAEGSGAMIELAGWLATDCPPGVARDAPPKRTPAAHVTVARRADHALVEDLASEHRGSLRARWTFDRLALMRSHLESDGARYETLHEATLYAAGR